MTYIIWNPKGTTPPSVTFDTREAAEAEARRLAEKHRGDFYVCELVSVSSVKAAETTNLKADGAAVIVSGSVSVAIDLPRPVRQRPQVIGEAPAFLRDFRFQHAMHHRAGLEQNTNVHELLVIHVAHLRRPVSHPTEAPHA